MKNTYLSVIALAVATASLSSCSKSNYAFNPKAPSYLGTTTSRNVAKAPVVAAPVTVAEAPVAAPAVIDEPVAVAPMLTVAAAPEAPVASAPVAAAAAAVPVVATTATPVAKPNLVQKIMLNKVLKRLTKAEARQQNTASTTDTTAKARAYLGLAAIGLVLLIIGLIVGSGFLDTIGAIAIVVGLIIFIFNNI